MLPELEPLPDGPEPRPGDLLTLRPGNTAGADPALTFHLVDWHGEGPAALELNHLRDHRRYQDWAAVVAPDDVATITRHTPDGVRTWAPDTPETTP
ncbi:DUF6211 family protein [Streptomyces luteireticuli]|uniref:Uncharacterized protein n=1 Tax=Streptomyces luteireticuli TaxID=173858 RepID=A0ABN0Z9Q5_9ACTN